MIQESTHRSSPPKRKGGLISLFETALFFVHLLNCFEPIFAQVKTTSGDMPEVIRPTTAACLVLGVAEGFKRASRHLFCFPVMAFT